jgi:predicted transcriptional regulator
VATELGISAQTARRHIKRMEKDGLVNYSIKYDLTPSGEIFAKISLYIKNEMDRDEVAVRIIDRYAKNVLNVNTFSTVSNLIAIYVWTKTMAELKELQGSIQAEEPCEKIVLNTPYDIFYFDTWLKSYVYEKALS